MHPKTNQIASRIFDFFVIGICFWFSWWLMWHTVGFDEKETIIRLAPKVWSDFGAHIPLIRSFSMGDNFNKLLSGQPPESPLFPGQPIRYHFLFYAIVGLLEKTGVRIDWAINIPSILGFWLLLVTIYILAKELFKSRATAILSLLFFIFNGTLSFLKYFEKFPLSWRTPLDIWNTKHFPSFGPWDGSWVTAFGNLNIYTNQRHLGLSFGLGLAALYLLLKVKPQWKPHRHLSSIVLLMITASTLLFMNQAAALIAFVFMAWIFLVKKETRLMLVVAGLWSIPALYFLLRFTHPPVALEWKPGYLTPPPITPLRFIQFWIHNLGLHAIFIPLGIVLSPGSMKKLLVIPMTILFIVPNLIQFSPDMINNHKFFNFFLIIGVMFSSYALVWLNTMLRTGGIRLLRLAHHRVISRFIGIFVYLFIGLFMLFLTLSGVIDLFAMINEEKGGLVDMPVNRDAAFFATQTTPGDIVLNSFWFYHPATIAGRAVYSGYPYFTWSYGYDKDAHEQVAKAIYNASTKEEACLLLANNNIDYVELSDKPEYVSPNWELWRGQFTPAWRNDETGISVYSVKRECQIY